MAMQDACSNVQIENGKSGSFSDSVCLKESSKSSTHSLIFCTLLRSYAAA